MKLTPIKVQCRECGKKFTTERFVPQCPNCGGVDMDTRD